MQLEGYQISNLHGGMAPAERDRVIDDFRKGVARVLIATNVIARGIDISQVSLVINYDVPVDTKGDPDSETYLHRIGRTGRFGRSGLSISLVHDSGSYNTLMAIKRCFGKPITEITTTNLSELDRQLREVNK